VLLGRGLNNKIATS